MTRPTGPFSSLDRRGFLKLAAAGLALPWLGPRSRRMPAPAGAGTDPTPLFWVQDIPDLPYYDTALPHAHAGVDTLLALMGRNGLKLYRTSRLSALGGPDGLIAPDDVVLVKVNAQWKYRGATNSDVVRGLIGALLAHPDGFAGEVVIFENGQGRGSLHCDNPWNYSDAKVHANAMDDKQSFRDLVDRVFADPRVSATLLDPVRGTLIGENDHSTDGYRVLENVSYPCFTTAGGNRVELKQGVWAKGAYRSNLKLINVPVLKHHDTGGSEITASLKHVYGIVSMSDGKGEKRHYDKLGETCGKIFSLVRAPVLNIIDAVWVCHKALGGYPAETTWAARQLLAGQDPVALDYFAAKHILYPIDRNERHHPDFSGIDAWLTQARDVINLRGGLSDPGTGRRLGPVTKDESAINALVDRASDFIGRPASPLVSPQRLVFAATPRRRLMARSLSIENAGTGPLSWRVEGGADWLSCAPASGTGPGRVEVTVDPRGLDRGLHQTTLVVGSTQTRGTAEVEVLLAVV